MIGGSSAASIRKVTVMSATCQGASGPFPNPNSCRSFLQCEPSGAATVIPCPANLEFSPKLRVCDYPERAGCSSSSSAPADDDNGNETGGGSNDSGVSPAPPSDDVPTCPAWNPDDVTQLPNPKDCSSFYKCDENGVAWLIPCPAGLEYNAELRVCDYPENAGCSTSSSPSNPPDDTPSEGEQDDGNSEGGSDINPQAPTGDVPSCPAWNPEDVTQHPNPSDCSSFYKCDENGVAWLIPCPAGLEYNAKLRVCDYPQSAGCSSSAVPSNPSGDESSDGDQNNGNADSGNGESPQRPPGDAPTCPAWNPNDVTQLPNPSDCNSFYKCDENGVAWLIPCPAGLQYNAELRMNSTVQGASGPFRNPNSCRSFLQCEPSAMAKVITCPANLDFNPQLTVSDFPDRAG
ncbi:chondroitin proteoglycan-2-like [Schistocerca piceifrons]|uniref:chondroitin proteoglycan-2-like n=1 Tax=Schistocerca piceifrons TaxID=274613 RepID=UPI001F5F1CE9|nr:chondroitin proteoglycan-2-like [Schistocerca piceifrons]